MSEQRKNTSNAFRRGLSVLLTVAMVAVMLPLSGLTSFAAVSGDFEYVMSAGKARITAYNGDATEVTFPAKLGGRTVSTIGGYVFDNMDENDRVKSITSITVESGITTIEEGAFANATSLTEVSLPDTLTMLGEGTFFNCQSLSKMVLPNALEGVSGFLFSCCYALAYVVLPSSISAIEASAFANCTSLQHVIYTGTQEQWANVRVVKTDNDYFTRAPMHCDAAGDALITTVSSTESTCVANGHIGFSCAACDATFESRLPMRTHTYEDVIVSPSCVADGYTSHRCTLCGAESRTNYVTATGHNSELVEVVSPTCERQGYSVYSCTVCGDTYEADYTSITDHLPAADGVCVYCGRFYPEHPYENNADVSWKIQKPNALFMEITFSEETATEAGKDFIYICNAAGEVLETYSGTQLAGATIAVAGDTAIIRLVTDGETVGYGVDVVQVNAYYTVETGDLNADGTADLTDYAMLLPVSVGATQLDIRQFISADLNKDTAVDAFDVALLDLKLNGYWSATVE